VVEVPDPENFDQRFYWGVGNPKLLNDREEVDQDGNPMWVQEYDPVTESMVNTDKRLVTKGLKSQWIAQVKDRASNQRTQEPMDCTGQGHGWQDAGCKRLEGC